LVLPFVLFVPFCGYFIKKNAVNITIPIYIQKEAQPGAAPPIHILRPLFHLHLEVRGEDLNRTMTKMAEKIRYACAQLGTELRHEELSRFSFAPDIEDRFLKLTLDLGNRRAECNFLLVAFRSLGRKLAFTPALPDLWFEIHRGETLADRALEVLSHHFRQKEKRKGSDALPAEAFSIKGKAWVSMLEISINPPAVAKLPAQNLFALLGGAQEINGAQELNRVGRCLDYLYPDDLQRVIYRDREVAELTTILKAEDKRPVLLIGERLVGKTAIIHEYVHRVVSQRSSKYSGKNLLWLLAPQRLISGMSYVGQWENRLLAILKEVKKQNHILYFDDLLGLYQAGQSASSTLSVADVLKPYVEKRAVRILGEISPEGFRVLQERDRGFADAFHLLKIKEPDEDTTFRILLSAMRGLERKHHTAFATEVFPTVMDVQRRYTRDAVFPGKAALFLQQLAVKFRNEQVTRDDVLKEFHAKSGLSVNFLNDETQLARQEVTDALGKEVIGQDAALEACADVVAMAKARLNDTDRPLASFLFLGPTGVGKTQGAKSLAAYLFGDADKIIRFDMNEYSTPYAVARLVGTFDQPEGLLTSAVRRQPFSVVLLDEIEKAHPDVFNLLLQVMGDGRLTDALGRTVDFTNAILILTSNLGVREAAKNLGFRSKGHREGKSYTQAAEKFFKPEFFNRLDRIVPFERLRREDVMKIAEGLMQKVFAREGLLRRKSVLQVDGRAMERIVAEGYHPQLGARALKRMLERELTQPVAAQLAGLKPDAPTLINVQLAGDRIVVEVQALTGATFNEANHELIEHLTPKQIIELAEQSVERIETRAAQHSPTGLINPDAVEAEQLAYFQIREQARRVRERYERLAAKLEQTKKAFVSRSRGRSISAAQFTLRQVEERHLWQRIIAAGDIRLLMRELATGASPYGERREDYLAELIRELALLNTIAQTEPSVNQAVILVESLDESFKKERELLVKSYVELFGHQLGERAEPVSKALAGVPADALLTSGVNVFSLAKVEEGVHLFFSKQGQLVPIRVRVLSLGEADAPTAIRQHLEERRQSFNSEAANKGAINLPPVLRLYEENGATLDLRSGLMTLKMPTVKELRALLLAALPLPREMVVGSR
jgi:ATP-dependent Clp protease ATP-binding subunit ClpC